MKTLFFILFLLSSFSVFGQEKTKKMNSPNQKTNIHNLYKKILRKDPLHKPKIWAELCQKPTNIDLWGKYIGKKQFDWTVEEMKLVANWKQILMTVNAYRLPNCYGFKGRFKSTSDFFIDELAYEELVMHQTGDTTEQMRKIMKMPPPKKGRFIKDAGVYSGIAFFVINEPNNQNLEDWDAFFSHVFNNFGEKYIPYSQDHHSTSVSRWIKKHKRKIKNLKNEQLQAIFEAYLKY